MIGVTSGDSYFITNVEPGKHLVTSKRDNYITSSINFEANKVYISRNNIRFSKMLGGARARLTNLEVSEASDLLSDDCIFYTYDKNNNIKLDLQDYD